ncbi:UDP-3-O-(3-hydroxymyristoyl)glucosamine N-acyltransferase [Candidatus Phycosocius spiralis]|uniref:UDP-3-O-acylglucosamine N-acyltransferase n=1 Tax=Candidatus Phycosocius spiralis TaxID=2815099 RepID=A0ABQ4PT08_9PROT|nr:UDP-3-O-(3-hydroxymyristoyl)glucosamine N-acyltransferase [Candidatus Phycosocius spiralis]GIU66117.1 UDP-3-O-acylglucosamine N-acyltransferase [Candidatus Phycosocius spiralis]
MIDPRFYTLLGPKSLMEVALSVGATCPQGYDPLLDLHSCAPLEAAYPGQLVFCHGPQKGEAAIQTSASACLIRAEDALRLPKHVAPLIVNEPRASFALAAASLVQRRDFESGAPAIPTSVSLNSDVILGHGVVLGEDVEIGQATTIGPNTVIGPGVVIGRHCRIGANVTIYCALIGDRVTIASGSVIGETGFGVAPTPDGPEDVPQLGRAILQDDVSIGSLCAVDRGAFGDTVVGMGCKIDNFTQIAHNCQLGLGVVIAAFGGISGSCEIGDQVLMGGRVGIADHVKIGAKVTVAAGSGVLNSIPAGESWGGYPAKPMRQWMRETVALKRLVTTTPTKAETAGEER